MRIMSRVIVGNEENISAWSKNGQNSNKRLKTLPPNVSGRSHGFLDFNIDRLHWNVPSYTNLSARVIWWGESFEDASSIKISSSSRNCINYGICTSTHLFRKYLATSEAIEVQFTTISKGVKRQVGTAFISIPEALMGREDDYFHPVSYTNTHRIFSPKNTTMGVMKVAIKLVLFDDIEKGDPLSVKNEQRVSVKDYLNYKKDPFIRLESSCSSSNVWSFLRGREMSARDEQLTLRELCRSSPAHSAIEAMDDELKWKLRDCYKRNRKPMGEEESFQKCHNPGRTKGNESEKAKTNEIPSSSNSQSQQPGSSNAGLTNGHNRGAEGDKKETGEIEDPLKSEKPLDPEDEYQGIFYVGGYRSQSQQCVPKVYAIAKSFDESIIKTHLSDQDLIINYLKIVPVKIDESDLERMNKGSLIIELWARDGADQHCEDVKIGTATVGLHQFYVAFRHEIVRKRLYDLSLPVTSMDGWAAVNDCNGRQIGELNVLVAMGTKRQVDYLVQSKQLQHRRENNPQQATLPGRSETASILSSFLDNLSQQIAATKAGRQSGGSVGDQVLPKKGELRKTSDLLDILQQSLTKPPPMMTNLFPNGRLPHRNDENSRDFIKPETSTPRDVPDAPLNKIMEKDEDFLRIYLEIQCAMHLPKITSSSSSGESSKSKRAMKKGNILDVEVQPSCYATFEARITENMHPMTVSSVEGQVYTTHVVEKSSNPAWNKGFTVEIPKDLLTNLEKFFIVKVWRKAADSPNLTPTPLEDVLIGFCTVDLTVLTAGLPEIAGCYNIVYFDGNCNGQLMLKLKPLEAVQHKDVLDTAAPIKAPDSPLSMLDLSMESDLSLSRALKRKFTELDEITQRLRARLHDVTSSDLVSSDDEFEKDLNTSVDEVDEEEQEAERMSVGDEVDAVKDDFNWLGHLTELQRQCVHLDQQMKRDTQTNGDGLLAVAEDDPGAGPSSAGNTLYTNGGGGRAAVLDSLETALKDAVLNDRPDTV